MFSLSIFNRTKGHPFGWREFTVETSYDIPRRAGVYVIYYRDRVFYVGSSCNLRSRITTHRSQMFRLQFPDKEGIRIKVKPSIRYGEWLMLEARLIKRLLPALNSDRGVSR